MIPYTRKERYTIDDLIEIVTLLRSKQGCPWDKVQTHRSIREDLIEEAYEVIEGIDRDDPAMLREELGDLLLQVVFHANIEQEKGSFTFEDICTDICDKLVTRHPHVFQDVQAENVGQALESWEKAKAQEKAQLTHADAVAQVARPLPALIRGQKIYKRAWQGNRRFSTPEMTLARMTERKHELERAIYLGEKEAIEQAYGEFLLCAVGLAQAIGVKAEQSLTDTTNRFVARFTEAENRCLAEGRRAEEMTEGEWEAIWHREEES